MAPSNPPVPAKLQEMLKDYPGHIERLQEVLTRSVERSRDVPLIPLDEAIDALRGGLETFTIEARNELGAARVSGTPEEIARAAEKLNLMLLARSSGGGMLNISELAAYIASRGFFLSGYAATRI